MRPSLKITQLVPLGFGVIVLITTITSIAIKLTTSSLLESVNWVVRTYDTKSNLQEIEKSLINAETGQRGFIYTGQQSFLEPYNNSVENIDNYFIDLKSKVKDNPAQVARVDNLQVLSQQKLDELAQTISLKRAGQEQQLRALVLSGRGKQIMDRIREEIAEMSQVEDQLLAERQKAVTQDQRLLAYSTWGSILAVIGVGILISWLIAQTLRRSLGSLLEAADKVSTGDLTHQIEVTSNDETGKLMNAFRTMTQNLNSLIRQVQQTGIQITTSTTQIAASGKQLEAAITEQLASTNEVVATAREIATNSGQLVKTMDEVNVLSQSSAHAASQGQEDIIEMQVTMRQLVEATTSISAKLGIISEKANNINSIVTTITKVADQTNLLSLNAAIEAEKAREYGLGFAVVAREIRRLADQTAVATLDIESMVKEMQSAVSTGVMEMDKFTKEVQQGVDAVGNIGLQLGQIIEQVQSLAPRFEIVGQGMDTQSQSAQQISEAMIQLREASMQTADALRETNYALEQLNDASQNLREETSKFKVSH